MELAVTSIIFCSAWSHQSARRVDESSIAWNSRGKLIASSCWKGIFKVFYPIQNVNVGFELSEPDEEEAWAVTCNLAAVHREFDYAVMYIVVKPDSAVRSRFGVGSTLPSCRSSGSGCL